ncbi:MAG: hypothetical protein ACM3XS_06305 [Bacteroidota bacterium]
MRNADNRAQDILLLIVAALFVLFATGLAGPARYPGTPSVAHAG